MNDLRDFLNKFLDTINYPDDKQEFINKLLSVIYLETIDNLIQTLPSERQALVTQAFQGAKTPDFLQQTVGNIFDPALFNDTLQSTSQKVFNEYLQTIETVLTQDQKVKLQQYFSSKTSSKMA